MKKIIKRILAQFYKIGFIILDRLPFKKLCFDIESYKKEIESLFCPPKYQAEKEVVYKNTTLDVSIIIPVYNSEKYLKECLDSIFYNETSYTYEVIVVNDGSTDSSARILESYNRKELIILTQENKGAAAARNCALDVAQGEYVAFIDSDDYVSSNYIQRLMDEARYKKCDIVKCGFYRTYGKRMIPFTEDSYYLQDGLKEKILDLDGFACIGIIKRKLFSHVRFPEGYWYEDMIMRPLIYLQGKNFSFLSDCMYYYRQHESNMSKTVEHSKYYQCLYQYYLPRYIMQYAKDIGMAIDDYFKMVIIKDFGFISYMRFEHLPKEIQKKLFYLNAHTVCQLQCEETVFQSFIDKYYLKAFSNNNFQMFSCIVKYNKWK